MRRAARGAVGVTATRQGLTTAQQERSDELLRQWRESLLGFRHGDCVGGDADLYRLARGHGYYVIGHPPTNNSARANLASDHTLDPLPYLERNKAIVQASAVLLACPDGPERVRSGTWSTVRYANELTRPVAIILPNGSCRFNVEYGRLMAGVQ